MTAKLRKRRSVVLSAMSAVVVLVMVVGFPATTASAATQDYYYSTMYSNTWQYSGARVWTSSSGFANEAPCCITMQAKAGTAVAQGVGGVTLFIAPSQQINRRIACQWIKANGWNGPKYYVSCTGRY